MLFVISIYAMKTNESESTWVTFPEKKIPKKKVMCLFTFPTKWSILRMSKNVCRQALLFGNGITMGNNTHLSTMLHSANKDVNQLHPLLAKSPLKIFQALWGRVKASHVSTQNMLLTGLRSDDLVGHSFKYRSSRRFFVWLSLSTCKMNPSPPSCVQVLIRLDDVVFLYRWDVKVHVSTCSSVHPLRLQISTPTSIFISFNDVR